MDTQQGQQGRQGQQGASTASGFRRLIALASTLASTTAGLSSLICAPLIAEELPRFPAAAVWNQDVSAATVHADSATMITTLDGLGGFGLGRMQIDYSLHVVHAEPSDPDWTIVSHPGGYYAPDCEPVGTQMPVPPGSVLEGEAGLTCTSGGDCHLLVVQGDTLYEAYAASQVSGSSLEARCLAIWHLGALYPPEGRGEHCTSADGAGFPIAPLLFNADDIAASLASNPSGAGDLGHAVRFILPNDHMASDADLGGVGGRLYVRPASHAGGPSGPAGSVPYGARLRLKPSFDDSGYSPAARVVLNTFKRFGMVLADGGNVALTAESDVFTDTTWAELDFGPHVFWDTDGTTAVWVTDFEVIDTGARIGETYECVRTDVQPWLFADGFESGDTAAWQ